MLLTVHLLSTLCDSTLSVAPGSSKEEIIHFRNVEQDLTWMTTCWTVIVASGKGKTEARSMVSVITKTLTKLLGQGLDSLEGHHRIRSCGLVVTILA